MMKCSNARPTRATQLAASSTAMTKGMPASIDAQVIYAPSVSIAPWPILITPMSPKMRASPSDASAKVKVSKVASIRMLAVVESMTR